jgi:hypothetical protein
MFLITSIVLFFLESLASLFGLLLVLQDDDEDGEDVDDGEDVADLLLGKQIVS